MNQRDLVEQISIQERIAGAYRAATLDARLRRVRAARRRRDEELIRELDGHRNIPRR